MAPPTVVAVGAVGTATTGACTPGVHAGNLADDIQLLWVEAANEPLNAITGFTRIGSGAVIQSTGLVTDLSVFWKRSVGGDTAPSITSTPQNHLIARIVGVRGAVTSGSPIHVSNTGLDNVADTAISIPGASTTAAGDYLVFAGFTTGADTNTSQLSGSFTNASLGSVTTQVNDWTISGNGGGIACCSGTFTSTGTSAYSATTATLAAANTAAMMSFAVQGAVAAASSEIWRRTSHPSYRR